MYISSITIRNYKSHLETGPITLTPGFNIITGQNNAGKTAFLEALSSRFTGHPHRSRATIPEPSRSHEQRSIVDLTIEVSGAEFRDIAVLPGTVIYLPTPQGEQIIDGHEFYPNQGGSFDFLLKWLLSQSSLTIGARYTALGKATAAAGRSKVPSYGQYKPVDPVSTAEYRVDAERDITLYNTGVPREADVGVEVAKAYSDQVYIFRAERLNVSHAPFGKNQILDSDARNLAEALNILQSNPSRYAKLNRYIQDIFPHVHWVGVRPSDRGPQELEIIVWLEEPENERGDLVVSLSECGTGISQVLAILYVVLTSDIPRTIIIDEPQSFLHPGAIRKLIGILRSHLRHQYVISTHSPTVIVAANPSTITVLRHRNGQSEAVPVDMRANAQLRMYLSEIGASLSDVFGADNVLWVEGPTEEECFPEIYENVLKRSLHGTAIVGVVATGDFEKRKSADLVFQIYQRLSKGSALIPPAVGFIFDRETRTERERDDLSRRSGGLVSLTGRRLFENYLLNAKAIVAVFNALGEDVGIKTTVKKVEKLLKAKRINAEYYKPLPLLIDSATPFAESSPLTERWLVDIHGARVLEDIFKELSGSALTFQKTRDSYSLARWVIENAPDDFDDLLGILSSAADRVSRDDVAPS